VAAPSAPPGGQEQVEDKPKAEGDDDEQERELAKSSRSNGFGDIQELLQAAYADSEYRTPIVLLLRDKSDSAALLNKFHRRNTPKGAKFAKLVRCPLGQGLEDDAEQQLLRATACGDWILLENLHLVDHWLPKLNDIIQKLRHGPELNPRFRVWIACAQATNLPFDLLQRSIKIAIEPSK
jgi:hypothetical protein|tara:strand:- start:26 stop:565 length:540 start_codon:yes stop_codon:yes gene_type:complete